MAGGSKPEGVSGCFSFQSRLLFRQTGDRLPRAQTRTGAMFEDRVERRLAAIIAADVAGYSRLMGEDEEGTLVRSRPIARGWSIPR
jgi:hypothetical protein